MATFVDDAKLFRVVETREVCKTPQSDLSRLSE